MTIHETMLSTFADICAELAARGGYTGAAVRRRGGEIQSPYFV